jgi:hypothetical protein
LPLHQKSKSLLDLKTQTLTSRISTKEYDKSPSKEQSPSTTTRSFQREALLKEIA